MERKKLKIIWLMIMLLLMVLMIVGIKYWKITKREKNNIKESTKQIIECLNNKYNVNEVKYLNKQHLLERYNTIAGDSGSGRRELDSYIYYYRFNYNNISTYAYIINNECYDDYYYEKNLNYVRDEFEKLFHKKVKIIQDYLDPEELLVHEQSRQAVIDIQEYSYNIINTMFIDKYIDIYRKISKDQNDTDFKLYLKLKDYVVLLTEYGKDDVYEVKFKENNFESDSKLINILDNYSFSDNFTILSNISDEEIKWSITNQKSYYEKDDIVKIEDHN